MGVGVGVGVGSALLLRVRSISGHEKSPDNICSKRNSRVISSILLYKIWQLDLQYTSGERTSIYTDLVGA